MSDFWVSQQKHWCKYCKKYVYNNKPTIQKHESGSVHKDNVERFLSDVYKKGRQDKKDAESVRRELQRIEKAAHKSMAGIGGSDSQPADHTTSYPPPPPPPSLPVRTPRYHAAPIPTLESLATPSPTAHLQGRDEWAIPQEKETAAVGQWQSVDTHPKQKKYNGKKAAPQQQEHTHDQAPEFQDDDEVADEDLNEFKFKEKEYPLDDDNLVGLSPAKDSADTEEGATSSGLFKKRKLGGQKGNLATKKRMIRKKGD